ncbi:uncharacterized protein J2T57_003696 [Natronocella acetinitrilica]|uniref:DUF418 domain-containing protein n=2 Tax=Natronocella acetinitrilica TaxID=414046 RepID=A0AAE3KC66_9GAMM|nr:uncharacterized protein [Natronocella acetinitrilica]
MQAAETTTAAVDTPRAASSRLPVLDVLRGMAILGILLMNIQSFGRLSPEYLNPKALGDPQTLDWIVWLINHLIADEKFISILTLLFGAGFLLMAQNSRDNRVDFERKFRRRMLWLFIFGMVHAIVLWPGDILAAYAICGLVAMRFRDRSPAELIAIGLSLFAGAMILWMLMSAVMLYLVPADTQEWMVQRYWTPSAEVIDDEVERLTTGWFAAAGDRAVNAVGAQAWMLVSERIWRMVGMMLIGMALLKLGFLRGEWSLGAYRRIFVLGVLIGFPVIIAGLAFNEAVEWDFRYSFLLGRIANHWGSIAVAMAWVSLFIFLVKSDALAWAWRRLIPVGRLALTNYIGQSVLCATVFYGFGLGLFGQLGNLELMAVVIGVWALQISSSALWFQHLGAGPLERLWRRLAR